MLLLQILCWFGFSFSIDKSTYIGICDRLPFQEGIYVTFLKYFLQKCCLCFTEDKSTTCSMCSKYVCLECISVIYDPDDTVVCNECQKQQEEVKIFFHETFNERIQFFCILSTDTPQMFLGLIFKSEALLYLQYQQISCFLHLFIKSA